MARLEAERLVYTVDEVAKALHLGRSSAYQAVQRGDIPAIRIRGRWLIPKQAVDRMLAEAGQPKANGT